MKSLLTRLLALALVLVFSVPVSLHAQLIEGRVVAPTLNVRSGPTSHAENVIGQLSVDALVSIEGRNPAGDWFYIRAEGSGLAGWAASGFIAYIQDQYSAIPVLTEAPPAVAVASGGTVSTGSADLIMQTPIFSNFTTSTVYSTFNRGLRLGNNPHVFMKVGDSVSATQPFLYGFGGPGYNLGPYADLQATIDFFSVSPVRDVSNSFVRTSVSAVNGFVSGAVFDGTWSPEYCSGLVPLECEYDILRPSVAIVLLGGQDVRLFDAGFFETNMRRIAVDLKALGVIPVFTTFPMHASYRLDQTIQFNSIVINLANEQDIPLINLYRALQDLPDGGAKSDDVVHLTQGPDYFNFDGSEATYGVTLRNLLTLQALDMLRRDVLQ